MRCPCFHAFTLLSENFPAKGFKMLPIYHNLTPLPVRKIGAALTRVFPPVIILDLGVCGIYDVDADPLFISAVR